MSLQYQIFPRFEPNKFQQVYCCCRNFSICYYSQHDFLTLGYLSGGRFDENFFRMVRNLLGVIRMNIWNGTKFVRKRTKLVRNCTKIRNLIETVRNLFETVRNLLATVRNLLVAVRKLFAMTRVGNNSELFGTIRNLFGAVRNLCETT